MSGQGQTPEHAFGFSFVLSVYRTKFLSKQESQLPYVVSQSSIKTAVNDKILAATGPPPKHHVWAESKTPEHAFGFTFVLSVYRTKFSSKQESQLPYVVSQSSIKTAVNDKTLAATGPPPKHRVWAESQTPEHAFGFTLVLSVYRTKFSSKQESQLPYVVSQSSIKTAVNDKTLAATGPPTKASCLGGIADTRTPHLGPLSFSGFSEPSFRANKSRNCLMSFHRCQ
ncbi:hypothetical protein L1987_23827 [Smallanthus sonchifolius]|uniref:Uncharacterized protein n=1 Tax=Smallanthus sonchifolius TaxID=185202 RepID=A0ACB9IJC3_9ASTR|nr:hypothetical protein L1987_23827 [Smallanthus sonchifolius]